LLCLFAQAEVDRMDQLKLAVLMNLGLCSTALGDYVDAVAFCNQGLQLDGNNAKLLFRYVFFFL
jgi:hypothetical protein